MQWTLPAQILLGAVLVLAGGLAYGGYEFRELYMAREELASTTSARIEGLERELSNANQDKDNLAFQLEEEKARNDEFSEQIEDLTGTVGKLDKLSQTDEELLQKYSKVYFLNENYIPSKLTQIPQKYIFDADDEFFYDEAWSFLKQMLDDAEDDGVDLKIVSAYRSFDTQEILKGNYRVTYGTGANAFSADQGYSEHQLGTALDFTTVALSGGLTGFQATEEYAWLLKNAHEYGFVLSYPEGNSYYVFEPWHWRFVGEKLARDLHDDRKHFYDLDQREIDDYLISIFD